MLQHNKYIIYKQSVPKLNIDNIKVFTKNISIYRPIESENLKFVKDYVINKLKEYGLIIKIQEFSQIIRNKNYNFSNIIACNPNSIDKYVMLAAHIDSPQINGCESAIDSASGIGIILELTRCILNIDPNYPLMIVFFDGEEAVDGKWSIDNTLMGSRYFVNNYDLSKISFLYLLDLIGGSIDDKIYAYNTNPESFSKIKKMYEINLKYEHQLFINPDIKISYKNISDDNVPFTEKNVYNLNFIPPKFPKQHHKITDTYANLNWDYISIFSNIFFEFLVTNV